MTPVTVRSADKFRQIATGDARDVRQNGYFETRAVLHWCVKRWQRASSSCRQICFSTCSRIEPSARCDSWRWVPGKPGVVPVAVVGVHSLFFWSLLNY
jgi:hypothetical protein